MTAKVAEHNMDELGTEYVETTAHAGARPDHAVWQGRVFHWNKGKKEKSEEKPTTPQKSLDNDDGSDIMKMVKVRGSGRLSS